MIDLSQLYMLEMMRKRRIADSGEPMEPLTLTALTDGSKVTLNKVGSPPDITLEYSTGGAWTTYTIGTEITLASVGDCIKFRGDNSTFSASNSDYYQFSMSGTIEASGNVMSLVDSTLASTTIPCDYCFRSLFQNCSILTTAPALPAMTLATYCYRTMFYGCSSLTAAPALLAMTLATNCYYEMFVSCSSLTTAPALPAMTLATQCYQSMFQNCSSLTAAPALPAMTLATYCYYQMFRNCTKLTAAPALPAMTLASNCYREMFRGCTKLSSIEVSFTSWVGTTNWVSSVASSGTFTKPSALAEEYGTSRIPTDWTVINK